MLGVASLPEDKLAAQKDAEFLVIQISGHMLQKSKRSAAMVLLQPSRRGGQGAAHRVPPSCSWGSSLCSHELMHAAEVSGCGCLEVGVRRSYPPDIRIIDLEDAVVGEKAAHLALNVAQLHRWFTIRFI